MANNDGMLQIDEYGELGIPDGWELDGERLFRGKFVIWLKRNEQQMRRWNDLFTLIESGGFTSSCIIPPHFVSGVSEDKDSALRIAIEKAEDAGIL